MLKYLLGDTGLIAAAVTAALAFLGYVVHVLKKSGRDEQKIKEAQSNAKRFKDAVVASRAKPTGSVSDDPNNRDNWGQ